MGVGKTIRIYLTDGTSSGPAIAEIMNWTGQVMVVPRSQLSELTRREELQRTGVYLLVGPDPKTSRESIYIGEADTVFDRLKAHDKDETKGFWTRAISITSKDFNLTKSHGRYLESRLIELANLAQRATVTNGTTPDTKTLPEPDVADMNYFLEQILLVLPVIGVDALRPLVTREFPQDTANAPELIMSDVGALARAKEIDGQFVVLKGSTARKDGSPSWDSYKSLREKLLTQGKLAPKDDQYYEFVEDVEFDSPSAAAAIIADANRNGRQTWCLKDQDIDYGQWKQMQVENAEH